MGWSSECGCYIHKELKLEVDDVKKFLNVDWVSWEIPCGPECVCVRGGHGGGHVW